VLSTSSTSRRGQEEVMRAFIREVTPTINRGEGRRRRRRSSSSSSSRSEEGVGGGGGGRS